MSLVLQEKHTGIEKELKAVLNPSYEGGCRRIVFVAAGNSGGNRRKPWSASMPGVIAIHATDGLGSAENFNPTARGSQNFATLGKDIQVRWKANKKAPKDIFVSGTSFATPIAAAIASNVLEYARWNLKLTSDQKKLLYSGSYMTKVFEKMMQRRGDYEYLQPWTLWEHGHEHLSDIKEVLETIIAS